jgi:uncharacterized phage-associated protein
MKKLSAIDIANYFLSLTDLDSGEGISNLKLQKIMYYAQALHLALFDKVLFEDNIEAWPHGPVISNIYHDCKIYKNNPIPSAQIDISLYPPKIQNYLNQIYYTYGQYSAWILRDLTHIKNTPWDLVYENNSSSVEIPTELMKNFYRTLILIEEESNKISSLQDKIEFCLNVEKNALSNPDLPLDFIASSLIANDQSKKINSLDD